MNNKTLFCSFFVAEIDIVTHCYWFQEDLLALNLMKLLLFMGFKSDFAVNLTV